MPEERQYWVSGIVTGAFSNHGHRLRLETLTLMTFVALRNCYRNSVHTFLHPDRFPEHSTRNDILAREDFARVQTCIGILRVGQWPTYQELRYWG